MGSPCALLDFDHLLRRTVHWQWVGGHHHRKSAWPASWKPYIAAHRQTHRQGGSRRGKGEGRPHMWDTIQEEKREREGGKLSQRNASAHARALKSPTQKDKLQEGKTRNVPLLFHNNNTKETYSELGFFVHKTHSTVVRGTRLRLYRIFSVTLKGERAGVFSPFSFQDTAAKCLCVSCAAMGPWNEREGEEKKRRGMPVCVLRRRRCRLYPIVFSRWKIGHIQDSKRRREGKGGWRAKNRIPR